MKLYLQCECGEVFDTIETAKAHENETCTYTIVTEDEAF